MIGMLAALALKVGVAPKFAKAAGIGFAVVVAILLIVGLKTCYDQGVIDDHEAQRTAATLKAQQMADEDERVRQQAADNRADAIEGAIQNAVTAHPEEVRKDAGPATRAALDELRRRNR